MASKMPTSRDIDKEKMFRKIMPSAGNAEGTPSAESEAAGTPAGEEVVELLTPAPQEGNPTGNAAETEMPAAATVAPTTPAAEAPPTDVPADQASPAAETAPPVAVETPAPASAPAPETEPAPAPQATAEAAAVAAVNISPAPAESPPIVVPAEDSFANTAPAATAEPTPAAPLEPIPAEPAPAPVRESIFTAAPAATAEKTPTTTEETAPPAVTNPQNTPAVPPADSPPTPDASANAAAALPDTHTAEAGLDDSSDLHPVNLVEVLVERYYPRYCSRLDGCGCQRCKDDVYGMALNKVKPHYVRSDQIREEDLANRELITETVTALMQALFAVKRNPHHDENRPMRQ